MMDLDEAIQHCEEVADTPCFTVEEARCYSEHRQLAEWLKELKAYKEQSDDAISRREALNAITMAEVRWQAVDNVNKLPSVSPQQRTGRWIPVGYDGYADGSPVYDWWECSECGWEHTGDEESLTAFCPNCGDKKEVK